MIISFYSYKGGVGRSQLCANIAAYLCVKKGKKVLLWDWDFEAPGLHYFFGKTNQDIQHDGTIELLQNYCNMMRSTPLVTADNYSFPSSESILHLKEGEMTREDTQGKIDLMPGGNYNQEFAYKVNTFNWFEFYELLDGKTYIESLKVWVKNLGYDYILIDSRTGINDYTGLCNIQLPDTNVVVMAANEQNICGCKRIIDQIAAAEYTKQGFRLPYILPILSRISTNHPDIVKWSDRFVAEFQNLLPVLDPTIDERFAQAIFRDFYLDKTLLEDNPLFSAGENILITHASQTIPRGSFAAKYTYISEYLLQLTEQKTIDISAQIDAQMWLSYAKDAVHTGDRAKAAIAYEYAGNLEKSIEYGGTATAYLEKGNTFFVKGNYDAAIEN
ncbi:MAG: hypothetical protein RLZZ292_2072, partial [Bacteroidota bacterium]